MSIEEMSSLFFFEFLVVLGYVIVILTRTSQNYWIPKEGEKREAIMRVTSISMLLFSNFLYFRWFCELYPAKRFDIPLLISAVIFGLGGARLLWHLVSRRRRGVCRIEIDPENYWLVTTSPHDQSYLKQLLGKGISIKSALEQAAFEYPHGVAADMEHSAERVCK